MPALGCLRKVSTLLALLLAVLAPRVIHAETVINVSSPADEVVTDGNCTLREAIIAANTDVAADQCPAGAGTDSIVLPAGTYVLTRTGPDEDHARTGDLDVLGVLSISGAGADQTIIDGGAFEDARADRVFHVRGTGQLSLHGVTVRGGRCSDGGGIYNAGWLGMQLSRVESNIVSPDVYPFCRAAGSGRGGAGVYNSGRLLLSQTTIRGNQVFGTQGPNDVDASGGGVLNAGLATIQSSVIDSNFAAGGGGIDNIGGLLVFDSHIVSNYARFFGGGLTNLGIAILVRTTVNGNNDAILNGALDGRASGQLSLSNSTVSGNYGYRGPGGVLNAAGDLKIISSTIAGNVSQLPGAGIGGIAHLANTIVSNPGYGDCVNPVVTWGNNLDSDGSCGFTDPRDLAGVDPRLGPLADNGGPTPTHALLPGSPAIDHIPARECRLARVAGIDQRGVPRPQPSDGACDIGSFELAAAAVPGPPQP